jgi:hypothetical protein
LFGLATSFPVCSGRIPRCVAGAIRIVKSQLSAIGLLGLEDLECLSGALGVDEVGVSEASRLAGSSVDGHADVDDVLDAAEEGVEIAVGHLEGHVADEEGFGGRVEGLPWSVCWTAGLGSPGIHCAACVCGVLDGQATAFEELLIQCLDGFGGRSDGFEVHISKSVKKSWSVDAYGWERAKLPFAETS